MTSGPALAHRLLHPPGLFGAAAPRRLALPFFVGIAGLAATATVAAMGGVPAHDAIHLLIYSAVGATAAGLAAAAVLRSSRRASITVQAVIAALAPVLAVAIGVTWAASGMFLMAHDLWVLWVVLVAAGTVAVITAITLGRHVAVASLEVTALARQLGSDGPLGASAAATGPGELLALARELETTSARLSEARQQADRGEHSRRELVAWVSHDLRTPLSGIRAMIEALEDGVVAEPDVVKRYYASIRGETQRLSGLVDDLFELSRIQAGALRLDLEPAPLAELVTESIEAIAAAASARQIEVRLDVVNPAPVLDVAVGEIIRVLRNVLDNALRHSSDGGVIALTVGTTPDGDATVTITDECGGIADDVIGRVFELGFRGDRARTPGQARGGLGLAVARGLVEAHHGDITVRNAGTGCCFTIRLPRHQIQPG
jgi:signal transduction histidine kinase